MAPPPLATVAIQSIGQMGVGVARLLLAHGFSVITNVSDRSPATQERADAASIERVSSDLELVTRADCTCQASLALPI
jgi:3-hydroxyisobutyrate dehydrogenase-like beta-hydroxyacid dehydrogenase